jgi:hypothetical protein
VGAQLPNPTPHTIGLRAAFMALDRWVRDGVEPPASKYPKLSDGTLTPIANLKWPSPEAASHRRDHPRAAARER